MKADARCSTFPVVMITAATEEESIVRCLLLGADDHLPKPFNPAILRARVGSRWRRSGCTTASSGYAKSLERELEIGREIQLGFLPDALPDAGGLGARARTSGRRARWRAISTTPSRCRTAASALVLADVCGKGVGAALFMALFRSLLRALAEPQFAAAASVRDGLLRHGARRRTTTSRAPTAARTCSPRRSSPCSIRRRARSST